MSGMADVADSVEREVNNINAKNEAVREERWAQEREDSSSLRKSLEASIPDDPPAKRAPPSDNDDLPRYAHEKADKANLTETLLNAFDAEFVNVERAEEDKKEIARFRELDRDMRRVHGTGAIEGAHKLLNAEAALRADPGEALRFLAQTYGDPNVAGPLSDRIYQRQAADALKNTNEFFATYDIPSDYEDLIIKALTATDKDGKFVVPRTGDHRKDLLAAYNHATRGAKHVR